MSDTLQFDASAAQRLQAIYTTEDVVQQRSITMEALGLRPGQRVLDLGSGPGFLAASIAEKVGPTGAVVGLDMSDEMLEIARRHCSHLSNVRFVGGDVADPPFEDNSFEHVVSTQVLEYVARVNDCLTQAHRILRPGGQLAIVDTDWDSLVWATDDPQRMRRVLDAWGEHLIDAHLPRTLRQRLRSTGFEPQTVAVIPIVNLVWNATVYSYGMSHLIASFVEGRHGITRPEVQAWLADLQRCNIEDRYFFSLNRYLFTATAAMG
jgi:arsenite methyltransferase